MMSSFYRMNKNRCKMRILFIGLPFSLCLFIFPHTYAQYTYGTTGLLNMPTADMQRDKTFMFGGAYLERHASTARWFYDTWNYYISTTIFPWLEVGYTCELHKAMKEDYGLQTNGF